MADSQYPTGGGGGTSTVFGPSGPSHSSGAVPDPGATPGTTHFLREDATWSTILTGTQAVFVNGTLVSDDYWVSVNDGYPYWLFTGASLYQSIQQAGVRKPQERELNFLFPFVVMDNPGNGSTDISAAGVLTAAMYVNGAGVASDKQIFINGITDGASAWGVNINGAADGG